jgi:DNA-binding NarL/FixJ family response regulator
MSPALRIFLCDDVPELRTLLRYGLEEDGDLKVVGETGDAQAAIAAVAELQPDVVVLDLSMPGMDGLEAISRLREAAPRSAILIFSGFRAARMRAAALELGAAAYLEKGVSLALVRTTVREVAAGR